MRGLILGLLLANTLYFSWGFIAPAAMTETTRHPDINSDVLSLKLITEVMSTQLIPYSVVTPEISSSSPPIELDRPEGPPLGPYCADIGAFESLNDANDFIKSNARDMAMDVNVRTVPLATQYRVYLPPLANREAAVNALGQLRSALVANRLSIDSFLIAGGDLQNGLALGLFSERANALNVRLRLEDLGYSVVIQDVQNSKEEVWVVVSGVESEAVFHGFWAEISTSVPEIQAIEKLCETIAHGNQFP